MSEDTIHFMLHKILHFEKFEDRIFDLENKNVELEVNYKILQDRLDKLTQNGNGNLSDADIGDQIQSKSKSPDANGIGSSFAENPFKNDAISADQDQDINFNQSMITSTAVLKPIFNESQDGNIENSDPRVKIENDSDRSEVNELAFTLRDIEDFEENFKISSISTIPEIISISGGNDTKIFDGSSNPSLNWSKSPEVINILQNVVVPLKKVDLDPNFIGLKMGQERKKVHKCTLCSREFQKFANFRRHFRVHTGEKPYNCPMCSKSFAFLRTFSRHCVIHSKKDNKANSKRAVKLDPNTQTFHSKSGTTVEKSRQFGCKICYKFFKFQQNLDLHMQVHNRSTAGEKFFKCTTCEKSFQRFYKARIHIRIHTGEKPYTCPDSNCQKKFSQYSSLFRHKRIHNGEKPYGCDLCPKFFRVKDHLVIHTRSHTGERPYICTVCDKKFICKSTLNLHNKGHISKRLKKVLKN